MVEDELASQPLQGGAFLWLFGFLLSVVTAVTACLTFFYAWIPMGSPSEITRGDIVVFSVVLSPVISCLMGTTGFLLVNSVVGVRNRDALPLQLTIYFVYTGIVFSTPVLILGYYFPLFFLFFMVLVGPGITISSRFGIRKKFRGEDFGKRFANADKANALPVVLYVTSIVFVVAFLSFGEDKVVEKTVLTLAYSFILNFMSICTRVASRRLHLPHVGFILETWTIDLLRESFFALVFPYTQLVVFLIVLIPRFLQSSFYLFVMTDTFWELREKYPRLRVIGFQDMDSNRVVPVSTTNVVHLEGEVISESQSCQESLTDPMPTLTPMFDDPKHARIAFKRYYACVFGMRTLAAIMAYAVAPAIAAIFRVAPNRENFAFYYRTAEQHERGILLGMYAVSALSGLFLMGMIATGIMGVSLVDQIVKVIKPQAITYAFVPLLCFNLPVAVVMYHMQLLPYVLPEAFELSE